MPYNVSAIFDQAAVFLNDSNKTNYTNTVMLPMLKTAYQELRQELEANNIPITNQTSDEINIDASTDVRDIGGPTGPPLPIDLIEPMTLWEKVTGTSDDYLQMGRRIFLPKTVILTTFLEVWSWSNNYIKFIGSTSDITVKIDYIGDPMKDIVDENTQVRVFNSQNALAYRTAGLCAEFIGVNESRAMSLNGMAALALETLIGIPVKTAQAMPVRRRSFRSRARANGWSSR